MDVLIKYGFTIEEEGELIIYALSTYETGRSATEYTKLQLYSDYALIPFDMEAVNIKTASEEKIISDYEELKEWWGNEE